MRNLPKDWYVSALTIGVRKDLEKHPEIVESLGSYLEKFVRFSAIQRVTYQKNIQEEFIEFQDKYFNKRLYDTDINLWKKISKDVLERDFYTCFYCGQKGGILEIDHYIPISKNGTNEMDNLKTACRRCNRQKKDKMPEAFEKWREEND